MTTLTKTKNDIIKLNHQKREEWIKNQEVTYIPLSSIKLVEPIHIKTNINFSKQVQNLRSKGVTMLNSPIIVKDEGEYQYSLVTGYKGLCIAQALYHTMIPAVIINKSRKEYIEELGFQKNGRWVDIKDIIIPQKFLKCRVSKMKVAKCVTYYKKYGCMDKPITLKGKVCVDGYSRLIASKVLNLDKVFCEFV